MQGVVPVDLVHLVRQQTVRLDHHERVTGFHGEHEVVVVVFAADARKLERAFHHPGGGVSKPRKRARAEAPVVHPDAHRHAPFLALQNQGGEHLFDFQYLRFVLLVGFVQDVFKLFPPIREVPGVDAYFVETLRDGHGDFGREVDIRDERGGVPFFQQRFFDLNTSFGFLHALHRDPDHLRARIRALDHLRDGRRDIACVARGHRLPHNRVLRPELDVTHGDGPDRLFCFLKRSAGPDGAMRRKSYYRETGG
mmetsp:Transcript_13919/g.52182  ORF Transcript_13919/g.52182 Transcript_13919/m.52182 type:complete len:252 (-) Transcript_13919:487-1242(-)